MRTRSLLLPFLALLAAAAPVLAAPASAHAKTNVVILKSASSKGNVGKGPYEEAAKGFKEGMGSHLTCGEDNTPCEVVIYPNIPLAYAIQSVQLGKPDLLVAFGAEAARFAESNFSNLPRVVALAPGIGTPASTPPEVSLVTADVPAALQIKWIADVLPDVSEVGVVFDPRSSQAFVDELSAAATDASASRSRKLSIVPIAVSAEGEVPAAFKRARGGIQALLFVPDSTVTTKGTIAYLLKETLAFQIPAIGFNWYFVDNGAVLGFGLDYLALGKQSATAAQKLAAGSKGTAQGPAAITVWVNHRVAQKLRIRTDYDPDKVHEIR